MGLKKPLGRLDWLREVGLITFAFAANAPAIEGRRAPGRVPA